MDNLEWEDYFSKTGYPHARSLGSGMEGAVYELNDELVGKVWSRRTSTELARLQGFYQDLASIPCSFATPCIHEIRTVANVAVTIEHRLHGTPLLQRVSDDDEFPIPEAVQAIITVLRGLRSVAATLQMRELAVLDEPRPLWQGSESWPDTIIGLMGRRVHHFGNQLRLSVPSFDAIYNGLIERVAVLHPDRLTAIHGDLCPQNILVDDACHPTAVLDFGFLSTAGDPLFDASIAAGIYNMYGPRASELDAALTERFIHDLGYASDALLVYRGVYAIISSNAYDVHGKDGHFAWCASNLRRPEIAAFAR
jgi:hypothetical protein